MHDLEAAVTGERWDEALALALDRWRSTRVPQLARLIDLLGKHVGIQLGADTTQPRWRTPYQPQRVSSLLSRVSVQVRGSDETWAAVRDRWTGSPLVGRLDAEPAIPQHRNWIERLLVMLSWPHDPRIASVLADWLTTHEPLVRSPAFDAVYGAIAERLVALADTRVVPQLEAFLADADAGFRRQRELVERTHAGLVAQRHPTADLSVTAAIDTLTERELELTALWRAVAQHPADLAVRAVLGDALVVRGDPRGELVTLQLAVEREPAEQPNRDPRAKRIARLVDAWWDQWFGAALAALLVREGTEIRAGMLEVIRVGAPSTPARAWAAARGHRELATVHTVRVGRAPAVAYAHFVAALPNLTTLEVTEPETLHELARFQLALPISTLRYAPPPNLEGVQRPASETLEMFAPFAPALGQLVLGPNVGRDTLDELVAAVPALFPHLQGIKLSAPSHVAARELAAQFAEAPLVTVDLLR